MEGYPSLFYSKNLKPSTNKNKSLITAAFYIKYENPWDIYRKQTMCLWKRFEGFGLFFSPR